MSPLRIHGIILAGGRSTRMGADKALLPVGGKPLLRHISDTLALHCSDITVVLPHGEPHRYDDVLAPGTHVAADREPGLGPLAGFHAGLSALPAGIDWAFVLACDMPVFAPELFQRMAGALPDAPSDISAVLCPGQPFHAMYRREAADAAARQLDERQLKLLHWIDLLNPLYIDPPKENCFLNMNTPEDYAAYIRTWE